MARSARAYSASLTTQSSSCKQLSLTQAEVPEREIERMVPEMLADILREVHGRARRPFRLRVGNVEAINRFAAEHDIDLGASYAYSDSASDLPMLRAGGNAVVVNPDAALLEVAKAKGWTVLRLEKLGRRLAVVGATLLAAAVGGGARLASNRRAASGRRRLPRR